MRVVEAIRRAPDPEPLPDAAWHRVPGERRRVVPGIEGLVAAAADTLSLYSELGAPWAPRTEHARYEVSTR
ncbi:Gfo/Idh/MocA family oxidoreductase [Streptomyces violaceorubidus]